ncbi:MAG TPA: carbamoyl phosphate synthase large subunit, partial [Gallionella sp.]|nr:carbamoyl phosphate synthase large subunit [Gallionella sp.]
KALRGLEVGVNGLDSKFTDREAIVSELGNPGPERIWAVGDAFRIGLSVEEVFDISKIDRWFLVQIADLVAQEQKLQGCTLDGLTGEALRALKRNGFADARLAALMDTDAAAVRAYRHALGVRPVYKRVDTCAAEFATNTAYMYSSYEEECEAQPTHNKKIMVLGGGPNRIGQGIEFDYCCVHAALAMREDGYET